MTTKTGGSIASMAVAMASGHSGSASEVMISSIRKIRAVGARWAE